MRVIGVRGNSPDIRKLLASVSALEKQHNATIQLFRADRVFGPEHLVSAAEKAERAFAGGTAMANTLGMEILLYAAAERQTSEALRKMGIHDGICEMAMVIVGDIGGDEFLAGLGLERDDSVLEPDGKDHSTFGIMPAEAAMASVPELVLEKVALSEIER
jgi:KEOPS complex subunit Cgi121